MTVSDMMAKDERMERIDGDESIRVKKSVDIKNERIALSFYSFQWVNENWPSAAMAILNFSIGSDGDGDDDGSDDGHRKTEGGRKL
jgi:hypothetical protein